MSRNKKRMSPHIVNCQNCRRRTGVGLMGNHWICEDCRITHGVEKDEQQHHS